MNKEALKWWFDEHDIKHHYDSDYNGFVLPNKNAVENETLKEIAACGAHITVSDRFNGLLIHGDIE